MYFHWWCQSFNIGLVKASSNAFGIILYMKIYEVHYIKLKSDYA